MPQKRSSGRSKRRDRVFISYRRDDAEPYAQHLFASLSARFGEQQIFIDRSTITPGAPFPRFIRDAIAVSGVMIVVIGRRWLENGPSTNAPRLMRYRDWVRREVELGLRQGLHVIPVLVDGADMPRAAQLPASLDALATRHGVRLPWHEKIEELSQTITKVIDGAQRYDLTHFLTGRTKTQVERMVVLNAMEISLAFQGERVVLDDDDLKTKFQKIGRHPIAHGVTMNEIMYVIDRVGVKGRTARGARRVYSARAYRLSAFDQIPTELAKGRPITAGMQVKKKWFSKEVTRTGRVDAWRAPGSIQGGLLAAIVGYEPADGSVRFLTYWPTWGDGGLGTLTAAAMPTVILEPKEMFSIEAAEAVTLR
jgi:TIR domain-containing protein